MPLINAWLLKKHSIARDCSQHDFIISFLKENTESVESCLGEFYPYDNAHLARKCVYCTSKGIKSNTAYKCLKCNVFLHPTSCFSTYHKELTNSNTNKRKKV